LSLSCDSYALFRSLSVLAAVGGFQRTGNNITLKESTVFVYDIGTNFLFDRSELLHANRTSDANSWEARKHSQDPVITNRAAFSLTAIDDTQLYLFAGCPDTDDFNDMWQYDTKANVWYALDLLYKKYCLEKDRREREREREREEMRGDVSSTQVRCGDERPHPFATRQLLREPHRQQALRILPLSVILSISHSGKHC
jgi:hypothetical protein